MKIEQPYRLIISGGGTGGHVFPAIAIAHAFRVRYPDSKILFVGANGKMEMTRVPEAGFEIIGLWISGITRSLSLSNVLVPFKLLFSYIKAIQVVRQFKPHAAVGTGGYASGPVMLAAVRNNVPTLIQEQNSSAGLTNRKLAKKVNRVCVAYPKMEKYFPAEKVTLTGNPVRVDIVSTNDKRKMALEYFGLKQDQKTVLVLGGSGGALTINQSMLAGLSKFSDAGVQVIWQTGRFYFEQMKGQVTGVNMKNVRMFDFVNRMDLAYAASDLIISRAGALAISEITLVRKPAIFIPSPNVADDHQTKNATALVEAGAAILIKDKDAVATLAGEALKLIFDTDRCETMSKNIGALARPKAAEEIVNEIEKLIQCN
ncbi:MAG: undecaprenyldiphospho-muramoylpentapeptide beta-N-acetylglucosaminyltransferase [Flammeovirgaceae bacterium]|nr:undecaprenyldiphospho-muramoylpentapeptide beta-N-acetylglucosaminyltransferase [Flammeovirgaceae bacterium]